MDAPLGTNAKSLVPVGAQRVLKGVMGCGMVVPRVLAVSPGTNAHISTKVNR
jgi:hypothetical protein